MSVPYDARSLSVSAFGSTILVRRSRSKGPNPHHRYLTTFFARKAGRMAHRAARGAFLPVSTPILRVFREFGKALDTPGSMV